MMMLVERDKSPHFPGHRPNLGCCNSRFDCWVFGEMKRKRKIESFLVETHKK
jgi:hypothetical protein